MNTQLPIFTRSDTGRLSRPQFSPVARRGIRAAVTRGAPGVRSFASMIGGAASNPPRERVPAWHRSFLDRLQPAVTRYHE